MQSTQCNSCKGEIINDSGCVNFPCPKCGKYNIIRCRKCREIVSKYRCPECEFEGPN